MKAMPIHTVPIHMSVRYTRGFFLRLHITIFLLKAAAWVSGWSIDFGEVDSSQDLDDG